MKLRSVCGLLFLVSMMACAARSGAPPRSPRPSPAALATTEVPWSKRVPTARLWPESAKHLQLIITPGYARGERFAWLIVNGTDVVAAFSATDDEIGDLVLAAAGEARATVAKPGDSASFGVLGSVYGPSPPRPPHAFPEPYVVQVLDMAWRANREASIDPSIAAPR